MPKKSENGSLEAQFWEPFGIIFASQFLAGKLYLPGDATRRVYGFTGGAQRSYLIKVK